MIQPSRIHSWEEPFLFTPYTVLCTKTRCSSQALLVSHHQLQPAHHTQSTKIVIMLLVCYYYHLPPTTTTATARGLGLVGLLPVLVLLPHLLLVVVLPIATTYHSYCYCYTATTYYRHRQHPTHSRYCCLLPPPAYCPSYILLLLPA